MTPQWEGCPPPALPLSNRVYLALDSALSGTNSAPSDYMVIRYKCYRAVSAAFWCVLGASQAGCGVNRNELSDSPTDAGDATDAQPNPTGPGSATLAWTKPDHNEDGSTYNDAKGYEIQYGEQASGPYPFHTSVGDVATADVTGLETGKTYYFVVRAVDLSDNKSAYSNEASKTIQ